ncbi:MAG: type II secretion system protein [Oscillospiraceae bacterium]|nr:type II secretion system protein [Oscillospiraceae bacterium]
MKKVKGFTIIELIVVIAIIAVLAAVIVPSLINYTNQARMTAIQANARNVYNASKIAITSSYEKLNINGGEIYKGENRGTAVASGGSDNLSIANFMGEDFKGYYAFKVSADGRDIEFAVWCNNSAIDDSEVKMYTADEMERTAISRGIGSYPMSYPVS